MDPLSAIVAPLIVAAITGGAGWLWGRMQARKKIEAAPNRYVDELDKLINSGVKQGPEKAVINGRAIVRVRDSLRGSLVAISGQLNSEIDRLALDLNGTPFPASDLARAVEGQKTPDPKQVYDTIQVLSKVWPAKREQVKVEIRKLLAELGLDPGAAKHS